MGTEAGNTKSAPSETLRERSWIGTWFVCCWRRFSCRRAALG